MTALLVSPFIQGVLMAFGLIIRGEKRKEYLIIAQMFAHAHL